MSIDAARRPRKFAVALVHHPVVDRGGDVVTSAVTNIDVHDLARSSRTYGAEAFFITTPIEAQRQLVSAILGHWAHGSSGERIPSRREALAHASVVPSIDDAVASLGGRDGVEIWCTAAKPTGERCVLLPSYADARAKARSDDARTLLIVFGTSWGLAPALVDACDARLPPIYGAGGPGGYNHLSVRAACAITLDRVFGIA
jgi:hypothetical protein